MKTNEQIKFDLENICEEYLYIINTPDENNIYPDHVNFKVNIKYSNIDINHVVFFIDATERYKEYWGNMTKKRIYTIYLKCSARDGVSKWEISTKSCNDFGKIKNNLYQKHSTIFDNLRNEVISYFSSLYGSSYP